MSALRSLILAAADSSRLQRFVQRYGFRLGAARFVAGESLDAAVPVLRRLNDDGLLTNTTLLGEGVRDEAETRAVVDAYRVLLDRIQAEGLRTNVALKLTHLGLSIDEELARSNLAELVAHAASVGNFVRIDMEESGMSRPRSASTAASATRDTTTSAPSSRRTCSAARRISRRSCRSPRTCGSSRARTSSRPRSRIRRRATSTRRTSACWRHRSAGTASPLSRRTTRR